MSIRDAIRTNIKINLSKYQLRHIYISQYKRNSRKKTREKQGTNTERKRKENTAKQEKVRSIAKKTITIDKSNKLLTKSKLTVKAKLEFKTKIYRKKQSNEHTKPHLDKASAQNCAIKVPHA